MNTVPPPLPPVPTGSGRGTRLADWLWAAARELRQQRPAPERDDATLAAMRDAFAARPAARRSRWRWLLAGPALCASALVGCVWLLSLSPPGESGAVVARGSDFIVLVSAERWAAVQADTRGTTAWLVPTELPRERLALLGLPYDPGAAADTVHAELLVHASGDVLAMRVMP